MYEIKEFTDKFRMIKLIDKEADSYVNICPERGGIVTEFNTHGEEVLYLNKDTFYDINANIRGGIPILYPLCGQLPEGKYELNGREYSMKNHGVARINAWSVIDTCTDGQASVTLRLTSSESTKESYPFEFELIFTYVLKGNVLEIRQEYINKSDEAMPMQAGFHPYFNVKDKSKVIYDFDATKYLDHDDLKIKDYTEKSMDFTNVVEANTILDHKDTSLSFHIKDLNRKITLEYSKEFKYMVVWSVIGQDFLCVEPWTAKTGALHTKEELIHIKPSESLKLNLSIKCEKESIL